jgi:hypothetical protein
MFHRASKLITLLLFLIVPFLLKAQTTNIEKYRLDKDTSKIWLGNAGFGFSSKKQQNVVQQYNGYLNLAYLSKLHSYMTINYGNIQLVNKTSFVSEGYTHWRINFFRMHLISYEPFVQYQYDLGRGLLHRELAGMSFRMNLLRNKTNKDKDKFTIGISTGAMYEDEFWKGDVLRFEVKSDTNHAHTQFIKSTSYLFAKAALHEKITLFSTVYYQARFDRFFRPRIVTDMQLMFKITKVLSFSTDFASTFDSLPIVTGNVFTYTFSGSFFIKLNN